MYPTTCLILNIEDLEINKVELQYNQFIIKHSNLKILNETSMFQIYYDNKLEKGIYQLSIHFRGNIRSDLRGFYKSSYTGGLKIIIIIIIYRKW